MPSSWCTDSSYILGGCLEFVWNSPCWFIWKSTHWSFRVIALINSELINMSHLLHRKNHAGELICRAKNRIGEASKSVILNVLDEETTSSLSLMTTVTMTTSLIESIPSKYSWRFLLRSSNGSLGNWWRRLFLRWIPYSIVSAVDSRSVSLFSRTNSIFDHLTNKSHRRLWRSVWINMSNKSHSSIRYSMALQWSINHRR